MFSAIVSRSKNNYLLILFCLLGFVSGLPFALVTTTFQAWLATQDVSIAQISLFSLVSIPYALKPFWAAPIDWLRMRFGINSRQIYFLSVISLCISLQMISTYHSLETQGMTIFLLTASFSSATIDICVDAMRIIFVPPLLQGLVSAWFVIFYRIAVILSGGIALVIADQVGWNCLYRYMSLLLSVVGTLGFIMLHSKALLNQSLPSDKSSKDFFKTVYLWLKAEAKSVCKALLFIFVYKFHGSFLASLLQVFLINNAHMSLSFIGYTYKTGGMLATFLGGLLAGTLSRYATVQRGVQLTVLLQLIATTTFLYLNALGHLEKYHLLITFAMYMESLCLGTSTTLITIIITQHCRKDLAATQYAFFTAVIAWQRSLITPFAGWVQTAFGWQGYFSVSLLFLPLLFLCVGKNFSFLPKTGSRLVHEYT